MPTQGVFDVYCSAQINAMSAASTIVPPFFSPIDIYRWGIAADALIDVGAQFQVSVDVATFDSAVLVANALGTFSSGVDGDLAINTLTWFEPDGTAWVGPYELDSDEMLLVDVDNAADTAGTFYFVMMYRRRPFVGARSTDLTLVTEGTVA